MAHDIVEARKQITIQHRYSNTEENYQTGHQEGFILILEEKPPKRLLIPD